MVVGFFIWFMLPMGLPFLWGRRQLENWILGTQGWDVRVAIVHGRRSLEIVRSNAIRHPHHGIVAAYGTGHHHALGSLIVLHLGEVLGTS
jgi:hypothetical protein